MDRRIATYQWAQLLVLSGVHFTVDMLGNILPSILPVVRSELTLSLSLGGFALGALIITANGVQLLTGHLRAEQTKPFFLHLGLALAVSICLLAALPRSPVGVSALLLLAIITGCGIAVVHPEGLRAVHALPGIAPAISTAVFMTGGFLGFASGGVVSTALVSRFGLPGLYLLIVCPVLGVLMVVLLRIRLAFEPASARVSQPAPTKTGPGFHLIMIMAIPAAVSTTLIALLLPTGLEELGFKLTFGGYSATMFGLGGALGSFVWAAVAHRKGELLCSTLAFLLAGPFALAYLLLINNNWAVWIIFAAGFCAFAAYILLITLARYAPGANLGRRMSWIVGGTWLFASVVFFPIVPIAERFGTHVVLQYVPLGYLLSGLLGLHIMLKKRGKTSLNQG